MAQVWPTTGNFPALPLIAGYTEAPPTIVVRTEMDAGEDKVRKRYTAGERIFNCQLYLTTAQVATLDAFFVDSCEGGAEEVSWVNPRTGTAATLRFLTRPQYQRSGLGYQASFSMEILPS